MSSNTPLVDGELPPTCRPFPRPFSTVTVRPDMGSVSVSIGHASSSAMRVRHSRGFAAASRDFRGFFEALETYGTFVHPAKGAARPRMAAQGRRRRRNGARSSETMADAHVPDASIRTLVVAGSANADVYCEVMRLPLPGETVDAHGYATRPGGKVCRPVDLFRHVNTSKRHMQCADERSRRTQGANQAAAAGNLGSTTCFLGCVGRDANAKMVLEALEDCDVDVSQVMHVDEPTGTAIILLQPNGENSIIIVGGANRNWRNVDESVQDTIRKAGALLLQREIPEQVNVVLAKIAKEANVPVYLDAGGVDEPISEELLSCLEVISPNETELARLTGLPTQTEEEVQRAAAKLLEAGVSQVLVKLGASGSMLFSSGGQIRQAAVQAPMVVDTTGAGDCFTAAYALSILEGKDKKSALAFAATAASLCIRKIGAMPSLPTRQETEDEIARIYQA